jgi:hypothetical protein
MKSIYQRCGAPSHGITTGAEGAMVGWSTFPVYDLSKNISMFHIADLLHDYQTKTRLNYWLPKLRVTQDSTDQELSWALESMAFNMYALRVELGVISKR